MAAIEQNDSHRPRREFPLAIVLSPMLYRAAQIQSVDNITRPLIKALALVELRSESGPIDVKYTGY